MPEAVSEKVLGYIQSAGLMAGDRLPAEIDLAQDLGLSRNSMREAYVDLIARGLITRKHGVGTFVSNPPLLNALGGTVGFWSLIESAGLTPDLRELARGEAQAPKDIAALLDIPSRAPISRMRWLFLANGTPCILIDHYLASDVPLHAFDVTKGHNAIPFLRDLIVIDGSSLSTQTTALNASSEIAGILQIEAGRAVLSGLSVVTGGDGRNVLASRSWMVPQLLNSQQTMTLTANHFRATSPQYKGTSS